MNHGGGDDVSERRLSRVSDLPLVGKPCGEFRRGGLGQVDEQLGEVDLGVYIMPAARNCQAGQDGRRSSTASVTAFIHTKGDAIRTSKSPPPDN